MGKTIIVTSGPTNERIDDVMKITNMSTGNLGAIIAERLMHNPDVSKVYYLSAKMSVTPECPDGPGKLRKIRVEDTESLLEALRELLTNPKEHIDAVIHSAAVGDYKGRYVTTAESLARDIIYQEEQKDRSLTYAELLNILTDPDSTMDRDGKLSSYENNLMVMLDLTPKVIGEIKASSPSTMLIGFKLLDGVRKHELFRVADKLRRKNNADYIVANDLSKIGNGKHWAMIVGSDGIVTECITKMEIAETVEQLVFEKPVEHNIYV